MADPIQIDEGEFDGPSGKLFRRAVRPAGPAWARLALIHGYGDHGGRYAHFYEYLARAGIASHALDLRGQGRSQGRRGFVERWDQYLDDVQSFFNLSEVRGDGPLFVLGHSHGALVTAAAIIRGNVISEAAGVMFTNPYFRSRMVVPRYKAALAHVLHPLVPSLRLSNGVSRDWMTSDQDMRAQSENDPHVARIATPRWWIEHFGAQEQVMRRACEFEKPLLILIGEADPLAHADGARMFFDRAGSRDKTYKTYPGLLHELLRETDRRQVFDDIIAWMRQHVRRPGRVSKLVESYSQRELESGALSAPQLPSQFGQ